MLNLIVHKKNTFVSIAYVKKLVRDSFKHPEIFSKFIDDKCKIIYVEFLLSNWCISLPQKFLKKYFQLSKEEIQDACHATFFQIMDKDDFEPYNTFKDIYKLAFRVSDNNIKNIIKEKKKCKSIEETAERAGINKSDYLDYITCGEDCSCMENELDLKLIEEAMPADLVEVWQMKCKGFSVKEISNELKITKRTTERRIHQAREYARALLLGNSPPPELTINEIKINFS